MRDNISLHHANKKKRTERHISWLSASFRVQITGSEITCQPLAQNVESDRETPIIKISLRLPEYCGWSLSSRAPLASVFHGDQRSECVNSPSADGSTLAELRSRESRKGLQPSLSSRRLHALCPDLRGHHESRHHSCRPGGCAASACCQ